MHRRTWTDPRDGTEWHISYNPGVELARPEERARRSRLIFEGDGERHHVDAVYGGALESLTDEDLQGLLDQARAREEAGDETAWGSEDDAPDS